MAKAQTLNFPKGASYMIPFQFRSPGNDVGDWTGWRVYFIVKKQLSDPDTAALVNQTIIADPSTGYNELVLSGTETNAYPVGRYFYQATVVDGTGTVGKSEIGAFIVEETTLLSDAGDYEGPDAPVGPPGAGEFTYGAVRPIILDVNIVSTVGMSPGIYDPRHIQADVFDVDNHTDGIVNRVFTAVEQDKLGGIANGATANATDAYLLARANHTGTQPISTVAGLQSALDSKSDVTALNTHINDKNNPHETTKTQVGLPNVDNTADAVKNVLSATKLTNARQINGVSFDGTANITIADSTKEPILAPGTTGQYYRGDKTWQTLNKAAVGLPNVDNTADSAKPISSAVAAALAEKVDKTTTANRIYNTSATGSQESSAWSWGTEADTFARRGTGGALSVGNATADTHAINRGLFNAAMALKSDKVDTFAVVAHGSNASTSRPETYGGAIWRGIVEPLYRRANDIWITPDGSVRTASAITNLAVNPSWEYSGSTVEVRRNYVTNPALASSDGIQPNSWFQYSNGGVGVLSNADGVQTVTATDLTALPRRFGVGMGTVEIPPSITGDVWHLSADITEINVADISITRPQIYAEYYNASNVYLSSSTLNIVGTGRAYLREPLPVGTTSIRCYIWFNASVSWSGTASFKFRQVLQEKIDAQLPYFDGSTNTWQSADLTPSWLGAADSSVSILSGQAATNQYPSPSPAWLSTDGPIHGAKFARTLITTTAQSSAFQIGETPNNGIAANETVSVGVMVRASRSVQVNARVRDDATAVSDGPVIASSGVWQEVRHITSLPASSGKVGVVARFVDVQIGDIVDIDNHFIVRGNYAGPYFDGSSTGFAWDGQPNNSTSTGATFSPIAYLPTTGGTVSGDVTITGKTNGVRKTSGTGMPNGSVIGSIGDVYTDINRTNGAYRWRKDSGDNTNTGWNCIEGVIETRTVATNATGVNFIMSRVDNMVSLNLQGTMPTPIVTGLGLIPTGFRPNTYTPGIYSSNGTVANRRCAFNASGFSLSDAPTASASIDSPVFTYFTRDAWPTVLPGSAV